MLGSSYHSDHPRRKEKILKLIFAELEEVKLTDEVQFRLATEQSCHKLKLRAHILMYVCAQHLSILGNILTTSSQ